MYLIISIILIILGSLGILNVLVVALKNIKLFTLPMFTRTASVQDQSRYQFYTQLICSVFFLIYGFLSLNTEMFAFYSYIIIALVTLIVTSIIGHLKFLLF
jgi:hypothetical protein